MAGFSDLPFRLLCRSYGAALACTEMISARGFLENGKNTVELLRTTPEDAPLVVQLFGSEPERMARAAELLSLQGFSLFDVNAGCPVRKVTRNGSGAALLRTPDLLADIVRAMVRCVGPGRLGVKLRSGWDTTVDHLLEICLRLQDAGAAWLTIHPRTAAQGYSGMADWSIIARVKNAVSIPVVASGDLFTAADVRECLRRTGADTVMLARGALRNPALFAEFRENNASLALPAHERVARIMTRHGELCRVHGGPRTIFSMRAFVHRYLRTLPNAALLRRRACSLSTWREFDALIPALRAPQDIPSEEIVAADNSTG